MAGRGLLVALLGSGWPLFVLLLVRVLLPLLALLAVCCKYQEPREVARGEV